MSLCFSLFGLLATPRVASIRQVRRVRFSSRERREPEPRDSEEGSAARLPDKTPMFTGPRILFAVCAAPRSDADTRRDTLPHPLRPSREKLSRLWGPRQRLRYPILLPDARVLHHAAPLRSPCARAAKCESVICRRRIRGTSEHPDSLNCALLYNFVNPGNQTSIHKEKKHLVAYKFICNY